MRPAQKAPENRADWTQAPLCSRCFNEAGAKSAGKRSGPPRIPPSTRRFNEAGAKSAGKLPGMRESPEMLQLLQ